MCSSYDNKLIGLVIYINKYCLINIYNFYCFTIINNAFIAFLLCLLLFLTKYSTIIQPVYIDVATLFSNQELLSKYNKDVPKTWDELMSTSKYIFEEEKKLNNTIMRYNGLFNGKIII